MTTSDKQLAEIKIKLDTHLRSITYVYWQVFAPSCLIKCTCEQVLFSLVSYIRFWYNYSLTVLRWIHFLQHNIKKVSLKKICFS
jgi:hypothetical protein